MPALSFSGHTRRGFFFELILKGEKTQTAREPRKRPIKEGDKLILYWKQRVPKAKKPIHLIGYATCTKVERLRYQDFAFDEAFAWRDGFINEYELQEWFGDPKAMENWSREYDVIHFQLLPRTLAEIISQASQIVKYYDLFEILKRSKHYEFWKGYLHALKDVVKEVFQGKVVSDGTFHIGHTGDLKLLPHPVCQQEGHSGDNHCGRCGVPMSE